MMYWSEWTGSDSAAILCAGMDGGNKRSQLSSGLHRPTSLALEQPSSTLFWADVVKNTVEMLNLNTGMHRVCKVLKFDIPMGCLDTCYLASSGRGLLRFAENGKQQHGVIYKRHVL